MFDKDLFISLCEKYGVEFSDTASSPMIKKGEDVRPLLEEDVKSIFKLHRISFEYLTNTNKIKNVESKFYLDDDCAMAC